MRRWTAIALCCFWTSSSPGAQSSPSHIDGIVSEKLFATICHRLDVNPEQDESVRSGYEVYRQAVNGLEQHLSARLNSPDAANLLASIASMAPACDPDVASSATHADRQRLAQQTLEARDDAEWLVLTKRLQEYLDMAAAAQSDSDQLRDQWIAQMASQSDLDESQRAALRRFIHRALFDAPSDDMPSDFERPIDVLELAAQASSTHEELDFTTLPEFDREQFSNELQGILYAYEVSLDGVLLRNRLETRRASRMVTASVAAPGDDRFAEIERASSERWFRRFEASDHAVQAIETLAERQLGSDAAALWRKRASMALCPRLAADRWLSRASSWVETLSDPDPALREAVVTLEADYAAAHLTRLAVAIETGVAFHAKRLPVGWSIERERHVRSLVALRRLEDDYLARLCSMLTKAQRACLEESIRAVLLENEQAIGPRIAANDLEAVGLRPTDVSDAISCQE